MTMKKKLLMSFVLLSILLLSGCSTFIDFSQSSDISENTNTELTTESLTNRETTTSVITESPTTYEEVSIDINQLREDVYEAVYQRLYTELYNQIKADVIQDISEEQIQIIYQ